MSSFHAHISIASFTCTVSDLTVRAKNTGRSETIFRLTEVVILAVTIEFSGSGAIAFLPLAPGIQVDFWAKSCDRHQALDLGRVTLPTQATQFTYTPEISLPAGFAAVAATAEQAYQISAVIRIGASGFPAMIIGKFDGLLIHIYE